MGQTYSQNFDCNSPGGACQFQAFYTQKDLSDNNFLRLTVKDHYERCGNGIVEIVDTYK